MLLSEGKWYRLNETNVSRLPETSGVYELSGTGAIVLYIGWAGEGGLQDRVRSHIKDAANPCIARNAFFFRFELSQQPQTRAAELLEAFRAARYGVAPECMQE
jgi:excinuclease UvrABC nuclease subunit